jgi:hypothetical protein
LKGKTGIHDRGFDDHSSLLGINLGDIGGADGAEQAGRSPAGRRVSGALFPLVFSFSVDLVHLLDLILSVSFPSDSLQGANSRPIRRP